MILQANALKIPLEDKSVHMICTSPPYWGLRDYGTATWEGGDNECDHGSASPSDEHEKNKVRAKEKGYEGHGGWEKTAQRSDGKGICKCGAKRIDNQLGLEPTPEEFLDNCVKWGREVWRVLRDDGCFWLNMGDSYAAQGNRSGNNGYDDGRKNRNKRFNAPTPPGLKAKDLCMMPARLAIALQADGWYLRSMMPWVKRSAMPESCTDRPASALEYVFLLTKNSKYYFDMDAIRIASLPESHDRAKYKRPQGKGKGEFQVMQGAFKDYHLNPNGRNFRNTDLFYQSLEEPHGMIFSDDEMVGLDVNPYAYKESHFATFPPKLIVPLIKAGTSERGCCVECGAPWERVVETPKFDKDLRAKTGDNGVKIGYGDSEGNSMGSGQKYQNWRNEHPSKTIGWQPTCKHKAETKPCVVFDPFGGSGTVKEVAEKLGRKAIVTDLSYEYCQQAKKRCVSDQMSLI